MSSTYICKSAEFILCEKKFVAFAEATEDIGCLEQDYMDMLMGQANYEYTDEDEDECHTTLSV